MAAEDTAVVVTLRANLKDYEAAMKTAVRQTERAAAAAEKAVANIGKGAAPGINQAKRSMDALRISTAAAAQQAGKLTTSLKGGLDLLGSFAGGLVTGVLGGGLISGFGQLVEVNTRIRNSLKVAGLEGQNLTRVYEQLRQAAEANGADFESLATLFSRLTIQSRQLGLSREQIILFVERMSQGLRASGTDAQQASDGIRQLTQAMASGVLRGDEFNSVMENLPVVAQAIADGLGVSIGKLRAMAADGQLTAKTVYDAFIKGSTNFAEQAAKTDQTFSQSMQNMQTALLGLADAADKAFRSYGLLNDVFKGAVTDIDALTKTMNEHTTSWDEFFRRFAVNLGILPAFMGAATDNSRAVDALAESFKNASGALDKLLSSQGGAASFFGEMGGLMRHDDLDKIVAKMEELRAKIKDNTATAQDFKDVIDLIGEAGVDSGDQIAASLEKQAAQWIRLKGLIDDPQKAVEELAKAVTDQLGTALDAIIERLSSNIPTSMQNWIDLIKQASQQLNTVEGQLARFPQMIGAVQGVPGGLTPQGFTFGSPTEAKTFLKTRANSAKVQQRMDAMDDEFAAALAKLLVLLPKARIESGVRTTPEQAEIWERSGHGTKFAAAPPGHSRHEKGGAADIAGVSSAELADAVKQIPDLETLARINDDMHVQLKKNTDATGVYTESIKKQSTALDDWLKKGQQAIDLKSQEADINAQVWDSESRRKAQIEEAKLVQDGLNAAMEQYGVITPEVEAKVRAAAHAQAELGIKSGEAADQIAAATQKSEEQAAAMQQFAEQIGGIASSAIGGFIQDLRNGVDAAEAFNNMLNRVIDSLIDMALQSLFSAKNMSSLFGSLMGGGGGAFPAAPGGLFHKGGVVGSTAVPMRKVNPLVFAGAPRLHGGLMPGEFPAILQRGEIVIPKGMAGRGGAGSLTTVNNDVGDINIDMSKTGLVTSSSEDGKMLGRHIQAAVQVVLVRESRPGGILSKPPGAR